MAIPNRASDAGPDSASCNCGNRRGDPCKVHDGAACVKCGNRFSDNDLKRCQGAVPDLCEARICPDCSDAMECSACGLVCCDEHTVTDTARLCDECGRAW